MLNNNWSGLDSVQQPLDLPGLYTKLKLESTNRSKKRKKGRGEWKWMARPMHIFSSLSILIQTTCISGYLSCLAPRKSHVLSNKITNFFFLQCLTFIPFCHCHHFSFLMRSLQLLSTLSLPIPSPPKSAILAALDLQVLRARQHNHLVDMFASESRAPTFMERLGLVFN